MRWRAAAAAALGVVFLVAAPPESGGQSGPILDQARALLHLSATGTGRLRFSAGTTWIAWPLAGLQWIVLKLSGAGNPGETLARTAPAWSFLLRCVWCLLAGLAVVLAAELAVRLAERGSGRFVAPETGKGPALRRRVVWLATAAAAGPLVAAPALAVLVRDQLPALPCAVVLLFLGLVFVRIPQRKTSADPGTPPTPGTPPVWRLNRLASSEIVGLLAGMILAWFPFAWPAAVAAVALLPLLGEGWRRWFSAVGLCVFFGLVLQPAWLLHPGRVLPTIQEEWRREGGWGGPGGAGLPSLLGLAFALGPALWLFWVPAFFRRGRDRAALALVVLAWALLILVPALSGVRRPGAVEWALAPLMAAWGGAFVGDLGVLRRRVLAVPVLMALVALGSPLPARFALEHRARSQTGLESRVVADLSRMIGPADLWLSEAPLPGGPAETGSENEPPAGSAASLFARGFVLPRDSRNPGRYDYAYWPRWYSGFQWVLVSAARVADNLARPGAPIPAHFYRMLEQQGRVAQEWGDVASGSGYRLYRLEPGSAWARPITATELEGIHGTPAIAWFLASVSALYLDSGDLGDATVLLRQGTKWAPDAASLYSNLGVIYLRQGDLAAAEQTFEQGLARAPRSVELMYNLARTCSQDKLYERAERLLRSVVAIRPDFAAAHYELARCFLGQGESDLAAQALRHYLELSPGSLRRPAIEGVLAQLARKEPPAALPQGPAGGAEGGAPAAEDSAGAP